MSNNNVTILKCYYSHVSSKQQITQTNRYFGRTLANVHITLVILDVVEGNTDMYALRILLCHKEEKHSKSECHIPLNILHATHVYGER